MANLTGILIILASIKVATSCPTTQCRCEFDNALGKMDIICDVGGLDAVPSFTPDQTVYHKLVLRGHNIPEINNNAFAGIGFEELDLSRNPITSIADYAFNGTNVQMKRLILHSNKMSTFPTLAINILRELTSLVMENFNIPTLPISPFQYLTKLEHLTLKSFNLQGLDTNVFQYQRNTLNSLDLDSNAFTSVPQSALENLGGLQEFVFSQQASGISISNSPFSTLYSLRTLDISLNNIKSLSVNAFQGLENSLQVLNIDHCKIQDSNLPSISGLKNLRTLKINHNNIQNIPSDIFSNMGKLEELDLQSNSINSLSTDMFTGVGATLERLYLEENQIVNLGADTFKVFQRLKDLHLDGQNISPQLKSDTFDQQRNTLRTLSLKSTGFTTTKLDLIRGLTELEVLGLSDNDITEPLPEYVFRQHKKMQSLDISFNKISSVSQEQLFGLEHNLTTFNVKNNQITTMEACSLHNFKTQLTIYNLGMDNNPLHCDCKLKWLKEKQERENTPGLEFLLDAWHCTTPMNRKFTQVSLSEFTCNTTPETKNCDAIYWQFTTTEEPTTTEVTSSPGKQSTPDPAVSTNSEGGTDSVVDPTGSTGTSNVGIIAGAAVGGVAAIAGILVAVILVYRRRKASTETAKSGFGNGGPRIGNDSKRFTRPPPSRSDVQGQNQVNMDLEGAAGGFEKNGYPGRAGSTCTVSTISNSTLHPRYVDDPTGQETGQPGYLYPASIRSGDQNPYDLDNEYDEIPAEGGYEEIHGRQSTSAQLGNGEYNMNHPYDMLDSPPVRSPSPSTIPPPLPQPNPRQYSSQNNTPGHTNLGFAGDYGQAQPGYYGGQVPQEQPQPSLAGQANLGFEGDYGENYGQQDLDRPIPPQTKPPLPPGEVNPAFEGDYGRRAPRSTPSRHSPPGDLTPYHVRDVTVDIPRLSPGEDQPVGAGYDPAREQYLHTRGAETPV